MRTMTFAFASALAFATAAAAFASPAAARNGLNNVNVQRDNGYAAYDQSPSRTANYGPSYDHCFNLATARGETPKSSTHEFNEFMDQCEAGQIPG